MVPACMVHACMRACLQELTDSQVGGGCWAQAPSRTIDGGKQGLLPQLGWQKKDIWVSLVYDSRDEKGTANHK